ncbi:MAG: sodium:solute symporter family protein [Planctomycetota bacterium]|nr:sodium:solute symporter family protein [Planctomycetota bacterium]
METLDYIVLAVYFLVLVAIGLYCARRNKKQEDYFMGGRGFGKLMQTFAAFGAGTGPQDPINTGSFTFTSGINGMWGTMYWLFVTPFYWITGVWYRRMRHLTLGDWFVERYESKKLGGAYAIFGVTFFMIYGSLFFSAIAKTAAPMIGDSVDLFGYQVDLRFVLVPSIGIVVLLYGMIGGLAAAYFTDLIQGICIILLSCILIPVGLNALSSDAELNPSGTHSGLEVMADQLPDTFFDILGTSASEFSIPFLIAIVFSNLIGIVVQPHFIATGGGSAKTENDARMGLVIGNFLKRFCTLGWLLTGLIAATLYADEAQLIADPDQTWGFASMQLLGPGLRGLMLACLLAALMSSVDAYMIVGAGLIVRNLYVPFVKPSASERECLWVGRLTGTLTVAGSIVFALSIYSMIEQLTLTFWFPLVFAAPFWIGMYWRRASTTSAWITVGYCLLFFSIIPFFGPLLAPGLRTNETLLARTEMTRTVTQKLLSKSALRREFAKAQTRWQSRMDAANPLKQEQLLRYQPQKISATKIVIPHSTGNEMVELEVGVSRVEHTNTHGGTAIFWDSITPVDEQVEPRVIGDPEQVDPYTTRYLLAYPKNTPMIASGNLKLNLAFFLPTGIDLVSQSKSTRNALELVPKIVMPLLIMILVSWITSFSGFSNSTDALDRYYAKMKTPVDPDPAMDQQKLEAVYANPDQTERVKLFPKSQLEIQKPTFADGFGFVVSVLICFGIIGLAVLLSMIGG